MNQKTYAEDILRLMAQNANEARSILPGIIKTTETDTLRLALGEMASLGQLLLSELHSRGKMYQRAENEK